MSETVDQDARRLAVETLDRPLLVEAGAGTGKTTLLLARLLHALEIGAVRVHEICAITFTEKAAAELRLRLRQALDRATATETKARKRLGQARRDLDRATVSTIHAFAASLLRERPIEAGLDPRFRVLDEFESMQLMREFWDRWVDGELEGETRAEHLRVALLAGVRLEPDLFSLARALEETQDVGRTARPAAPPAGLQERMAALRDSILECVRHGEDHCRDERDLGLVKLRALAGTLAGLRDLEASSWTGVFWHEVTLETKAGRRDAWQPGACAANKNMRRQLRDRLEGIQREIQDELLHDVLGWLETFRSEYAAEKRRRGVLDFQDLLFLAREMVRSDPAVRRVLGQRIGMLCVDEFQDTDPLQAEIVLFLAESETRAHEWQEVRVGPKLFLVGDPKQSIYRFRRADLEVYERCADLVQRSGGMRLDIVQNFRSRPAILHWVNGVFADLFANGPRHVPLVPVAKNTTRAAVWILRSDPDDRAGGADAWRRAEAQSITSWISRALEEGWPVRDAKTERPLCPGDIAILFGRTNGMQHYENALRRSGLAFQQEGGRLFFRRQEIRDVLHALAAIDDPHDELSIVAVLRSVLFGASDEELWQHRAQYGGFRYLETSPDSTLRERFELLAKLHAERHVLGVAGCIERLLDETQVRVLHLVRPQGLQALDNLDRLQHYARQYEATRAAGLRGFVRSLRMVDRESPRLAEWSPREEGNQRVRLLTVHAAKGLEFPCVVLANLGARRSVHPPAVLVERVAGRVEVSLRGPDLGRSVATAGYAPVWGREKDREESEERRLLYVAATRARDYLVVPRFSGTRPGGMLSALQGVPGAFGDAGCGALSPPGRGWTRGPEAAWRVLEPRDLALRHAPRTEPSPPEGATLWRRRDGVRIQEAARQERGAGRPRVLLAPDETQERSIEGGARLRIRQVLHRVLDKTPPGLDSPGLRNRVRETAVAWGAQDQVRYITNLALVLRHHELERRVEAALGVWRGLPLVVRVGEPVLETHVDLLFEEEAGFTAVHYLFEPGSEDAILWRVLALESAGMAIHEAGVFDLSLEQYQRIGDLERRVRSLRSELKLDLGR